MEQKNLSVFGTVIRNEEIADFVRLVNLTREIFQQELTILEIMPGGLTNKNFRAVAKDGTQVAIRLAGQGTANYINRPGGANATQMASLGIAPEIYYYDPKTGSQIVEYIDAPTMHPMDFQNPGRGADQGRSGHAPLPRQRHGVETSLQSHHQDRGVQGHYG